MIERRHVSLTLRYALFAAIATLTNLGGQWAALHLYGGPLALPAAMVVGTGIGLLTKYVLDKRWIFDDRSRGVAVHARKFTLYTLMGVFTTAIFWGTELAFDALSPDGHLRFVGAVLGLAIGYVVKYRLDAKFVFQAAS